MSDLHYLAVRRGHHGNLTVLFRPYTSELAWGISEAEAIAAVNFVQRNQTKVHGQTYYTMAYTKGTLSEFLREKQIRY